jgi:hypothetical protein
MFSLCDQFSRKQWSSHSEVFCTLLAAPTTISFPRRILLQKSHLQSKLTLCAVNNKTPSTLKDKLPSLNAQIAHVNWGVYPYAKFRSSYSDYFCKCKNLVQATWCCHRPAFIKVLTFSAYVWKSMLSSMLWHKTACHFNAPSALTSTGF